VETPHPGRRFDIIWGLGTPNEHLGPTRVGGRLVPAANVRMSPSTAIETYSSLAREGRRPPNLQVLLTDRRWEARRLPFIELSGVDRVVDEVRAEECSVRMDGRIAWKEVEA